MSERTCPAYLMLTVNNMSLLPPEFSREGRIHAVFSVYLLSEAEWREIFPIHLRKRNRSS
jgi:SpoVK/Ycf46/Vps4 family AAA+-type ATPase